MKRKLGRMKKKTYLKEIPYVGQKFDLEITFRDSPSKTYVTGVTCIVTEGGLLRLVFEKTSIWYPLVNVFILKQTN